jgi:hypothetical protein
MQFVIRAMAAHADVEHILAPALDLLPRETRDALPQDFAFDLGDRNNGLEELLKCTCTIERIMR